MAGELVATAKKVRTLPNQMARAGTKAISGPVRDAYKRDTGGDGKLSGLRGMPAFKAPTSVRGTFAVRGTVKVKPAGPGVWLNTGTKPRPQGRGMHPGTSGKRTFDRAVDQSLPEAQRVMERLFDDAVR